MDGSRHTVSTSRARGRHVLPWLRRSRTNRLKLLLAPAILSAAIWVSPALSTTYTVCASGCAFTSIQTAINDAGTQAGDTISLAAETYAEAVTINKQITLVGVGSSTVIDPPAGLNAITITGSGASASSRLVVKDLKVTGAEDGIYVATGDDSPISYITLDGITATGNLSNGMNFNNGNTITDVLIDNSTITLNGDGTKDAYGVPVKGNTGVRIATNVPTVNGFVLEDSTISQNTGPAFAYNPSGTLGKVATGIYLRRLTIANNVQGLTTNTHDISIAGWGSTSSMYLSDLTVTLGGSASSSLHGHGIVFQGKGTSTVAQWEGAGTISLSNITVTGSVPKTALYFLRFTDTTGVSLSGVDISAVTPGWGVQFAVELPTGCGLNLGTTVLKTVGFSDSADRTCQVNGQSAVFKSAASGAVLNRAVLADNFMIEDQVVHSLDNAVMGFLRWKASSVFVTSTSGSIQRGINAASSGDTVSVKAGSYAADLLIDRVLTLNGAKAGVAAGPGATPAGRDVTSPYDTTSESVVTGGITVSGGLSGAVTIDGFIVNTLGDGIYINTNGRGATIRNNILTGRGMADPPPAPLSGLPYAGAAAIKKIVSDVAATYRYLGNRLEGGGYGIQLNSQKPMIGDVVQNDIVTIDGNYFNLSYTGIQTYQDTAVANKGVGILAVTNNRFNKNSTAIRLAQGGHAVVGNTVENLVKDGATGGRALKVDLSNAFGSLGNLTVTNNSFDGGRYSVWLYKPIRPAAASAPAYTIQNNSLTGAETAAIYLESPQTPGGTITVDATKNWWGQDSGPGVSQIDAQGQTVTTSDYLTSGTSTNLFPTGFWPAATPVTEVTAPLAVTSDAPPVVAAVDLGGGASTSLVLDFGAVTGSGSVTVTPSETPSDGSVSFAGNTPIKIEFTGTFTPPVKVCLSYDDSSFPVGVTPALWHYTAGAWEVLETVSLDTVNKILCALTNSFSDFGVGIAATDACDNTSGVLTVTIPDGLDVTVARNPSNTLTVTFDVGTECSASPATIGSNSGAGQIRTLALVGGSGNETVTFATATPTNWGANSTSSLARTIDLGAGSGDLVILQGTGFADTITASAIASAFTNVESLQLEGLGGTDTLTAGSTPDVLYGGAGNDILKGGDGNDTFFGGDDNDSLQGGAGFDCADYSSETDALTVDLTSGSGTGGTAVDTDTYTSMECVKGGSGNDTLKGSAYGDTFYGNGGDDTLQGRGGPDTLNGGTGTGDTVTYAEQTYAVVVNLTAQTATGTTVGTGGDTIVAGTVENVIGGSAGDTLVGDAYANTLTGGAGNDTLVGMGGNDSFTGGTGIDTVSYDDVVWPGAAVSGITVSLASSSGQTTGGAGEDTLVDTFENVTGSSYVDGLTGNSLVNIINGLGGVDTVNAGGGNDTVNGGAGGDTLNGEAGADTIRGGDDDDTINGGADADAIWGDAGGDTLLGGAAGDTLRGGAGNDILVGGSGTGVDVMYGDADTDTISYDSDTYTAGAYGNAASTNYVVFKLSSVGIQQATNGAGTDVAGDLIENLTGTSGNDTLIGNSLANVISGLGGADVLQGGDGNDFLYAGEGTNNKAEGQAGTDTCTVSGAGTWVYLWPKTCEA